jgi:hypothetical protein
MIAYNCHGSIVFLTRIQDILITWLIPALVVAGACGLAARKRAKDIPKGGDSIEEGR